MSCFLVCYTFFEIFFSSFFQLFKGLYLACRSLNTTTFFCGFVLSVYPIWIDIAKCDNYQNRALLFSCEINIQYFVCLIH